MNIVNNRQNTKLDLKWKQHKGKIGSERIICTTKIYNYNIFLFYSLCILFLYLFLLLFHWCVYLCISQSTFFLCSNVLLPKRQPVYSFNVALILLLSPYWLQEKAFNRMCNGLTVLNLLFHFPSCGWHVVKFNYCVTFTFSLSPVNPRQRRILAVALKLCEEQHIQKKGWLKICKYRKKSPN